jgi:hypothetical protein
VNPELREHLLDARDAEQSGQWSKAAQCYSAALPLMGHDHRLHANLGNALWLADEPFAARDAYEQAIDLAPTEPLPQRGLGNVLRDLGAFEQADHAYARSRALADDPLTAWNHSQLLLGLERYGDAFEAAERRLELAAMLPFRSAPYASDHPSIRSQATIEPLYLWSEQGLGDTLQYVRWLASICQQPNAVHLEVEHQLVALLQQGLSWLSHPPQVLPKPADGSPAPPITAAHLPLMSLPHRLGGAPLTGESPYLRYPSGSFNAANRPYPSIGLVWAAGRKLDDPFTAREYHKRSLPPQALSALVEGLYLAGAQLVNLQVGLDRDAAAPLSSRFAEVLPHNADFAATATLLRQLDLVITVDTAMAHLAGALGHPAWVLLPWSADPRWLRERSDSPWYPSLRLWRQPRSGDWLAVVDALLQALPAWWREISSAS